jgi:hypothetical protein
MGYLGLEPFVELDNVRVMHARQHRHLVVHHRLVALDTLLQDDLDGALAVRPVGLSHDAIGAGA